jgi:rhodanese-related sulfurtransferase
LRKHKPYLVMNKIILFTPLLAVMLFFASCGASQVKNYKNVNVNKAEEIINTVEDVVVLDVRTPQEFKDGHIENAINIDIFSNDFDAQVEQLDKSKTYVVICRSGGRSANASNKMVTMGFEDIYNVEGGFISWNGAKKPSVK